MFEFPEFDDIFTDDFQYIYVFGNPTTTNLNKLFSFTTSTFVFSISGKLVIIRFIKSEFTGTVFIKP